MTKPPHEDEDPTNHDLEAPPYDMGPPTIETQRSPFHHLAGQVIEPKITSKVPTSLGIPSVQPILVPPSMLPELDPAGPTAPDGHPLGPWDTSTDPSFNPGPWIDATPTSPAPMPPPDAPNILVSQSLMLEAADHEVTAPHGPLPEIKPQTKPQRPPRRHAPQHGPGPHAPTEVALPAIKRKKKQAEKEGSDLPLILGLIGLGLLIAVIVAAISYAVVRSVSSRRVVESARVVRLVDA